MIELKTVEELVDHNHTYAYVLDCYGIEFYNHQTETIAEACGQRNLNVSEVCHNLEAATQNSTIDLNKLQAYPLELVVEYLKHAHHIFVKKSLPYMVKLVDKLKPEYYRFPKLIEDLKLVFPMFAEDFIHHIYEEEDELFHYIQLLTRVHRGNVHYNKVFEFMESFSLTDFTEGHENADDEMRGIRELTSNYTYGIESDIHIKTIYRELLQFEKELVFHADVENTILLPRAITLESEIRDVINKVRALN